MTDRAREAAKLRMRKLWITNPEFRVKQLVRRRTQLAIRRGKIIKTPCVACGNSKSEAHHIDYERPWDVVFLCRKCHKKQHRNPTSLPLAKRLETCGVSVTAVALTHCVRGHEFTPENTYIRKNGTRMCRQCNKIRALNGRPVRDYQSQPLIVI